MTNFYDARGLFWSLRPQNIFKCVTQSAEKSICMGKCAVPNWAEFRNHVLVVRLVPEFFFNRGRFPSSWKKTPVQNDQRTGAKEFTNKNLALLLKIQSAITQSILGVRGSSSNSRKLSTITFSNMPIETWKLKIKKNKFCSTQTDSMQSDDISLPNSHQVQFNKARNFIGSDMDKDQFSLNSKSTVFCRDVF